MRKSLRAASIPELCAGRRNFLPPQIISERERERERKRERKRESETPHGEYVKSRAREKSEHWFADWHNSRGS